MRSKKTGKQQSCILSAELSYLIPKCVLKIILDFYNMIETEKLIAILQMHTNNGRGQIVIPEVLRISWTCVWFSPWHNSNYLNLFYFVSTGPGVIPKENQCIEFYDLLPSRGYGQKVMSKAGYVTKQNTVKEYYRFMNNLFAQI